MMTPDEMIAVIQAYREGREIEARNKNANSEWGYCKPRWDFGSYDYRIKPEPKKPREWWIGLHPDLSNSEVGFQACVDVYPTKPCNCNGHIVHVREVLHEEIT